MALNYALIADTDLVAAQVYLSAVRELGLATAVVRDGNLALSTMMERGAPAVLITELTLPSLDGFDLIEGLRRSVSETRTPVIAVSADRDLRDRADAMRVRLGIGAILARAASEESVRRVIRRILGAPEDSGRRPWLDPGSASGPRADEPRYAPSSSSPPGLRADEPRYAQGPLPSGPSPRATPPFRIRAGRV